MSNIFKSRRKSGTANFSGVSPEMTRLLLEDDPIAGQVLQWGRDVYGEDFARNNVNFANHARQHGSEDDKEYLIEEEVY